MVCILNIFNEIYLFNFVIFIASVADLADLLKSEPQDDFIVGLQDTLSNVFSSPIIYSLAYVKKKEPENLFLFSKSIHFSVMIFFFVLFNNPKICVQLQPIIYLY